ncbi:MAG TPA: hypothetical protein VFI33_18755 [Puia sp.]|nr:hypothetical protein [Puia sp.]
MEIADIKFSYKNKVCIEMQHAITGTAYKKVRTAKIIYEMLQTTLIKNYLDDLDISFPDGMTPLLHPDFKPLEPPASPSFKRSPALGSTVVTPAPGQTQPLPVEDGKDQAMIVDKSLISFVSGLSAENRADILESTLLAQLGANSKVPDGKDVIGWYKAFIEILTKVGWTMEGGEVQQFSAKANVVELQSVIIDILKAAFGADFLQIVTRALDGIKALADSNGKIEAFEKNTHSESNGSFQIGVATQEGDAVSMNLGTFLITTSSRVSHILFIKFSKDETDLQYASGKLTLDQKIYENVRNLVQNKLSGRAVEFVTEIPV